MNDLREWIEVVGGEETVRELSLLPLRGYQHGHVDTPLPPLRGHPATPRWHSVEVWGRLDCYVITPMHRENDNFVVLKNASDEKKIF